MSRSLKVYVQALTKKQEPARDRVMALQGRIRSAFPAGFGLEFETAATKPGLGLGGFIDESALPGILREFKKNHADVGKGKWGAHLLVAGTLSNRSSVFGVMYDSDTSAVGVSREGCAVFADKIDKQGDPDKDTGLARTVAHELGHVLNLDHADDPEKGLVMDAGLPLAADLRFEMSQVSRNHLLRHCDTCVGPGDLFGCANGDAQFPHPPRSNDTDSRRQSASEALRIEIAVSGSAGDYRRGGAKIYLGEPLLVRVILRNAGKRTIRLPRGWGGGPAVQLEITQHDNRHWRHFRRPFQLCSSGEILLRGGGTFALERRVFFGRSGFFVSHPGRYQVRAVCLRGRAFAASRIATFTVGLATRAREREALRMALSPRVARALEIGVAVHDDETAGRLHEIAARLPANHVLAQWARLTLGRGAAQAALDGARSRVDPLALLDVRGFRESASAALRQEALLWRARVQSAAGEKRNAARTLAANRQLRWQDDALSARVAREHARLEDGSKEEEE